MSYNLTEKNILYLINKLGDKVEGRKKLMKLMFLLEHYDVNLKKLVSKGLFGNTFLIYYYGVFSLDIQNYVNELTKKEVIKDGLPLKTSEKVELDPEQKDRIENIIEEFGNKSGYQLEVETLKMMNIEPSDKQKFFRKSVSDLIHN